MGKKKINIASSCLYEVPTGVRSIETESRGCQGLGEGDGELVFNEDRVSVGKDGKSAGVGWW